MDQLRSVVAAIQGVLGQNALGAYLHGSVCFGGLRPASDLDVFVVVSRSLNEVERGQLAGRLSDLSRPHGERSLEVTVVESAYLNPWEYPARVDFLYGDWLRDALLTGSGGPAVDPTLAITAHQVREADATLFGPPASTLVSPVPAGDLVRASRDGVDALIQDLPHDTRNVLLTLARAWYTTTHQQVVGKDVAAAWALERLPIRFRPVMEHARTLYLQSRYSDETWPDALLAQAPDLGSYLQVAIEPSSR